MGMRPNEFLTAPDAERIDPFALIHDSRELVGRARQQLMAADAQIRRSKDAMTIAEARIERARLTVAMAPLPAD